MTRTATNIITLPALGNGDRGAANRGFQLQTTSSAVIEKAKAAFRRLECTTQQVWEDWAAACLGMLELQNMALTAAKTTKPRGGRYHQAIRRYLALHGLDRVHKTTRAIMVEAARNLAEIERWRAGLDPEARLDLNHPRVVLTHWKRSLHGPGPVADDRPNPFLQGWIKANDEQITIGLSVIGFDTFRPRLPSDWHKRLVEHAARLHAKEHEPDSRITAAVQSALDHITVADGAKTSTVVAKSHEDAALADLHAAAKILAAIARSAHELSVGLAKNTLHHNGHAASPRGEDRQDGGAYTLR
jgi:hypothetical protein